MLSALHLHLGYMLLGLGEMKQSTERRTRRTADKKIWTMILLHLLKSPLILLRTQVPKHAVVALRGHVDEEARPQPLAGCPACAPVHAVNIGDARR